MEETESEMSQWKANASGWLTGVAVIYVSFNLMGLPWRNRRTDGRTITSTESLLVRRQHFVVIHKLRWSRWFAACALFSFYTDRLRIASMICFARGRAPVTRWMLTCLKVFNYMSAFLLAQLCTYNDFGNAFVQIRILNSSMLHSFCRCTINFS